MSDERKKPAPKQPEPPAVPATPRPMVLLFAGVFVSAMVFNVIVDAFTDYSGERITFFLGLGALLILGVDVGKIIGRN